jgi:archaeosine synthase
MADVLGRTVLSRHRYARVWGLGDRKNPVARTPGVVLLEGDLDLPIAYAPFEATTTDTLPAHLSLRSRGPFSPPDFSEDGPDYSVSIGHVLPPSLEDANAGEPQGTGQLLPVSWQRLHHDAALTDPALAPEIVVLTDAVQLASQPGKLPSAILTLKHRFPGALLWTPGLGGPDNLAALVQMGVDLVDLARCHQASAQGMILTQNGPRLPLPHEVTGLETQAYHLMKAIDEVHAAVANGSIQVLAVRASLSSPRLVEHLRKHQAQTLHKGGLLASHVDATQVLECFSPHMLNDPIVTDWERFLCEEYVPPQAVKDVMIFLPCSARKPYRLSKSHAQFLRAIRSTGCHEVMMTSPLGLVPRDLEDVWPAANYDVPVTGDWSMDELDRVRRMLTTLVANVGYRRIINHTGMNLDFLDTEVVNTRQGDGATHHDALERLAAAVQDAVSTFELRNQKNNLRLLEHYKSIARKTTGTDAWLDGVKVKGKLPRWKLEKDGEQIAVWSIDRNGFSFSRASIDLLHEHGALKEIVLHPDVLWKGDVFAQHVTSFDAEIRSGDDLRVLQNGACIGLARAVAPGWEWGGTPGMLAKAHQRKKKQS